MNLLHPAAGPPTPAEVRRRLVDRLAYSTVVTVLSGIHDKGLLRRAKDGRAFRYAPAADPHGLTARRMRQELEAASDPGAVPRRPRPHDDRAPLSHDRRHGHAQHPVRPRRRAAPARSHRCRPTALANPSDPDEESPVPPCTLPLIVGRR